MNTAELIVILVVILLVGNALFFVWRSRHKGDGGCSFNGGGCNKGAQKAPSIITIDDDDSKD